MTLEELVGNLHSEGHNEPHLLVTKLKGTSHNRYHVKPKNSNDDERLCGNTFRAFVEKYTLLSL